MPAFLWTHSCAKTPPMGLRGLAIVELEQAAESLTTHHRAGSNLRPLRRDELVPESLVRPFFMISDGQILERPLGDDSRRAAPSGPSTRTSPTQQTVRQMRSNWDSTQAGSRA